MSVFNIRGELLMQGQPAALNEPVYVGNAPYRMFVGLAVTLLVVTVPMAMMAFVDTREIYDVNVWAKPLKFSVSLAVYSVTLAFLSVLVNAATQNSNWFKAYCGVILVCILYEVVWVFGAASLGIRSHFNTDTPLMDAAYATAGIAAVLLTSGSFVFGVLIAKNTRLNLSPALKTSIWTSSIAMCVLTLITAGYLSSQTSHFVGGNLSDAEAIPLLGWSTDGGDLRVAHFFASHTFHFVPLFTFIASKLGVAGRLPTLFILTLYVSFVCYTFCEALAGYPFLHMVVNSF